MKSDGWTINSELREAYRYIRDGVTWRLVRLIGEPRADRIAIELAGRWRPLLNRPLFAGIAGSVSKTTTKELLLGILSRAGRAKANPASLNMVAEVARTILHTRPADDFCIVELSEQHPGALDKPLALLQPSIGIVTVIGKDHWSAFRSRAAIAAEVGKLVACLPPTGTAVLNADDELVLAMAATCAGKVITYGLSPEADIRAEDISATWPDRLEMTVARGPQRVRIRTQLCGTHWVPSVLGAIGGGIAAGMTLDQCAEGIASVAPFEARMQPVTTPDGVTFIRDDWKAPLWTLDSCLEFMGAARAKRKIIVIGTISDCGDSTPQKYAKLAKRAQEIADITIFVGPWASSVLKVRKPGHDDALRAFSHVRQAAEYINSIAREGDLVLLKGTNKQDHLLRIILARTADVACWRDDCQLVLICDACPNRTKPSGAPSLLQTGTHPVAARPTLLSHGRSIAPDEQVIVGLGNPDPKYVGTPHNVGYEVVDALAVSLGLTWDTHPDAWMARGAAHDRTVCLVKLRAGMNHSGAALKTLAESMSFGSGQCILIYDDLDLQLGTVRIRTNGGAGGHRGVASILEAFQTDAFRRVKVGVGQPEARANKFEYVLTTFAEENRATVARAIVDAKARVVEWLARGGPEKRHSPPGQAAQSRKYTSP